MNQFSTSTHELYEDEQQTDVPSLDREDIKEELFDQYLNSIVTLPKDGHMRAARVKQRALDVGVRPVGTPYNNPMIDTCEYIVEFPDVLEAKYLANVIAENMWNQCDVEGNEYLLMGSIINDKTDGHAVQKVDRFTYLNGRKHHKKSTKRWLLCMQWKDGSTSWERLADIKESNPVKVAKYTKARGIGDDPAR